MYQPQIDTDVPLTDFKPSFSALPERVDAAIAALADLEVDVAVSDDDIDNARAIAVGGLKPNEVLLSSPGTVVHLKAILSEYDKAVVESAAQIRTFVTNKLLVETTSPDPRIRIKALELLGKISDVGLFTEKTEITMRHRPTEELEELLRQRLMKTVDAEPQYTAPPVLDPAQPMDLAVDDVFGESDDTDDDSDA